MPSSSIRQNRGSPSSSFRIATSRRRSSVGSSPRACLSAVTSLWRELMGLPGPQVRCLGQSVQSRLGEWVYSAGTISNYYSTLDASETMVSAQKHTYVGQSCRGWSYGGSSSSVDGLVVSNSGAFSSSTCDTAHAVACCARIIVVPKPAASLQLGTGILGLAALSGRAVCGS